MYQTACESQSRTYLGAITDKTVSLSDIWTLTKAGTQRIEERPGCVQLMCIVKCGGVAIASCSCLSVGGEVVQLDVALIFGHPNSALRDWHKICSMSRLTARLSHPLYDSVDVKETWKMKAWNCPYIPPFGIHCKKQLTLFVVKASGEVTPRCNAKFEWVLRWSKRQAALPNAQRSVNLALSRR